MPDTKHLSDLAELFSLSEATLAQVAHTLIDQLGLEAVWLATYAPLPQQSYGLMSVWLNINHQEYVALSDEDPTPLTDLPTETHLGQISLTPQLIPQDGSPLDHDLADTFFSHASVNPQAIVPLIAQPQRERVGIAILCYRAEPPTSLEPLMRLGRQLGGWLWRNHQLETAQHTQNQLAEQNRQLRKHIQDHIKHHDIINQVYLAINLGRGLSEMAKLLYQQFSRLFTYRHINVSLVDERRQQVRQWLFDEHGLTETHEQFIPLVGSALEQVLSQHPQGMIVADVTKVKAYLDDQILYQSDIRAKLVASFHTPQGLRGSMTLGHQTAGHYRPRDLELLQQISSHIGPMIEKAQHHDELARHNNQLQLLHRLGEMLVYMTELKKIVETSMNMLPRLLPGDVQVIILGAEEGAHLGAALPYNFTRTTQTLREMLDSFVEFAPDEVDTTLITNRRLAGNLPVSAGWEPQSSLSLPILTRFGVRGMIFIASQEEQAFTNDSLRMFSLVVSQISSSVENALLFQQTQQESARLSAILTSSTNAVLVVNRNGQVVLDNPSAWPLMGVHNSQRGKLLAECTDNQALIDLFETTMQGGSPTQEIRLVDGRTFYASISPVQIDSGSQTETIGWVATMQDVSYFKELNELKNEFVNAVSHDLRSPLSSILISTHLIPQVGQVDELQQELLGTTEKHVHRMADLIDNILDVGKIEAGAAMVIEPLSLSPLLTEAISAHQTQADHKSIQLELTQEVDLPILHGDTARLDQVFKNLVGNAVKYTLEGGLVTVRAYRNGTEVRISPIFSRSSTECVVSTSRILKGQVSAWQSPKVLLKSTAGASGSRACLARVQPLPWPCQFWRYPEYKVR